METIVVDVDGSSGSDDAVRFAAREARLREARLLMVAVWATRRASRSGGEIMSIVLEKTVERLAEDLAGLDVQRVTREGRPASELVEASRDAIMLVVGSRSRGGFPSMLLGSVSGACAQHATCPVAIVHAAGADE